MFAAGICGVAVIICEFFSVWCGSLSSRAGEMVACYVFMKKRVCFVNFLKMDAERPGASWVSLGCLWVPPGVPPRHPKINENRRESIKIDENLGKSMNISESP